MPRRSSGPVQGVYPGRPETFTVVSPDAAIPAEGGPVAVGWREATADEAVVVRRARAAAALAAADLVRLPGR